ncbi:MAG TPA: M28 family peptidase [Gemmatimonadales bacterium]|nr:M28 family peptidase [Gemmatimonadales bacterium]
MRKLLTAALLLAASPAVAQKSAPPLNVDSLRANLFALAADSMGGRQTGSLGDWKAQEWVAAELKAAGWLPAGENGGYFQVVPFIHISADPAASLSAGGETWSVGKNLLPLGPQVTHDFAAVPTVYGGSIDQPESWPDSATVAGRVVVFSVPDSIKSFRPMFAAFQPITVHAGIAQAAGIVMAGYDRLPPDVIPQILAGRVTTDTTPITSKLTPRFLVAPRSLDALFGPKPKVGAVGAPVSGSLRWLRQPLDHPARNIIARLPGSDPALRGEYVSMSAHHDHVGFTGLPVDHDSVYAYNRVVRPMGADSPQRPATPAEETRVKALRDSVQKVAGDRPDSIFNGADDDGSGTVGLMAVARSLAAAPHPRRSILIVSHAAEERGLLGSAWFTDHPTVPRDSIVGEIDMDMVGRGNASDLPKGGPGYLEVVGAKRLSTQFGELFEKVNAGEAQPFTFNYEFDVPGHPLQYYCRADHYSYARFGIPATAISRGEHADYHQVTDEAEYIDYAVLARVATLARDFAVAVANLDHRPVVDGPRQSDPHGPCRQ